MMLLSWEKIFIVSCLSIVSDVWGSTDVTSISICYCRDVMCTSLVQVTQTDHPNGGHFSRLNRSL